MGLCGITGWVEFDANIERDIDLLYKMTTTLSKRGPDATNYWSNRHVGFGHKRLSVVDPVGGKQPMVRMKDNHRYVLSYNGELYNTDEIRHELALKGYQFEGHSDTEVLLTAYIEWQENCLARFNGIFAFSIWDEKRKRVFIARDRLGVKPLFYSHQGNRFLFGSEMKAILAHPEAKAVITMTGLAELLGLGPSRIPGSGVFKQMEELRPGHYCTFSRKGFTVKRYWNVVSKPHTENYAETVEHVRFLVEDAVKRQLVSDVPLCTFLSGGIDSSAITAIAAKEYHATGKRRLHTYSVDYEGNNQHFVANDFQPNADADYINLVRKSYNTEHHNIIVGQDALLEALKEATLVRDLPGMADIDASLLLFCKEIRKDFVVGLSGECADEVFGGYPWFYRDVDLSAKHTFPWIRSTDLRSDLLQDDLSAKLDIESFVSSRYLDMVSETPLLDGESKLESERRQLFYMCMNWFMATLLDRKDRMSMAASIEVRVPFSDHRIVEYAWNIPWEMKMSNGREKGILRDAVSHLLPQQIVQRKKSPYPKTHHPRYTEIVKAEIQAILRQRDSVLHTLFAKEKLNALVESGGAALSKPWFGQLMTGPQLLAYFIQIHYWFEQKRIHIEG